MNISWMTIRDLEYLSAVAEYLHFGKAAAAVHVSQPTLSTQIRKTEELLEATLFERTRRQVTITPVGEVVIRQVRAVLREAEKICDFAAERRVPFYGKLRIGAIATLGPYFLPHLLPFLKKEYPRVELFLKEDLTDVLLADLKSGTLDLVLASWTFTDESLQIFPLFREPFQLAFPKNHALAKKSEILPRDLRPSEMVLLEDGHCLRDEVVNVCPANRRGNLLSFQATSLETVRHLVAAGMGYTLMPQLSLTGVNQLDELIRYRKIAGHSAGRKIVLVCRKSYEGKDIHAFLSFLFRHLPPFVESLKS